MSQDITYKSSLLISKYGTKINDIFKSSLFPTSLTPCNMAWSIYEIIYMSANFEILRSACFSDNPCSGYRWDNSVQLTLKYHKLSAVAVQNLAIFIILQRMTWNEQRCITRVPSHCWWPPGILTFGEQGNLIMLLLLFFFQGNKGWFLDWCEGTRNASTTEFWGTLEFTSEEQVGWSEISSGSGEHISSFWVTLVAPLCLPLV